MTLGQNIQNARRAQGLSQEALAEKIGVSRQALGKWEKDTALPGLDNLQALAAEQAAAKGSGGGGGGFLTAPGRFLLLPQQGKVIGQLGRQGGASGIRLRLGGDGVFSPQQGGGREADTAEGESDQQAELEGGGMKNRAHSAAYGQ